ncbi:MAG: SpoVA/SpoVAEb family sporulation membrane protein [Bacilli bacterium]
MIYIYSFLFAGFICLIAQMILDNTKLTAGHITSMFVVIGTLLDLNGFYDNIVLHVGGGALVPITSFGHLLIHGGLIEASETGHIGLITGILNLTAGGITTAVVFSFLFAIVFNPKD